MKSDPYHQDQSGTSTTKYRAVSAAHIPYVSQHSTARHSTTQHSPAYSMFVFTATCHTDRWSFHYNVTAAATNVGHSESKTISANCKRICVRCKWNLSNTVFVFASIPDRHVNGIPGPSGTFTITPDFAIYAPDVLRDGSDRNSYQ